MKKEFSLMEFIYPLKKRWYVILIFLGLGIGLAFYQSGKVVVPPPMYQVSSQIVIPSGSEAQLAMLPTYEELLYTQPILALVNKQLEQDLPSLQGIVAVQNGENSRIVSIIGTSDDKDKVVKVTSVVTDVFSKELPKIVGANTMKVFSPVSVEKVVETTTPPASQTRTYILFIVGAFVLSLFPIYLIEAIRNTVRSEEEIEVLLGAPILGSVKTISKLPSYGDHGRGRAKRKGEQEDDSNHAGV